MALTQAELNRMVCAVPDCKHDDHEDLVLVPQCHPISGLMVRYMRDRGSLQITCRHCDKFVAEIAVAWAK